MTAPTQENQVEQTKNDKELNFRALETKYQRALEEERQARLQAEQALHTKSVPPEEDEEDDEPYVVPKKLNKKFSSFEKKLEEKIEKKAEQKAYEIMEKREQEKWISDHKDFYQTMQTAEQFAEANPNLANMILRMPEGFERQRLVYENIKAFEAQKAKAQEPSIQNKIDANKRNAFYQPSGIANAPYAAVGDFSPAGQKNAYDKMQELKTKLRI
jgi:hypothetical protein